MAEWYEDDEKIHNESPFGIWWKGTKKNAHNACPAWLANNIGFSTKPYEEMKTAGQTLLTIGGAKMTVGTIAGAGYAIERFTGLVIGAHAWCAGSYVGGGIDALYQSHHGGDHLISMRAIDWYVNKEQGVEDFLIKFHEWWKS